MKHITSFTKFPTSVLTKQLFNGTVKARQVVTVHHRYKSWLTSMNRSNASSTSNSSKVIIEEPEKALTPELQKLEDIRTILRSTDIPSRLRNGIIADKLTSLIRDVPDFKEIPEVIPVIQDLFMELYKHNSHSLFKQDQLILHPSDIIELMEKTSLLLIVQASKQDMKMTIPDYFGILIQHYLQTPDFSVSDKLMVDIILVGSRLEAINLHDILTLVINSKSSVSLRVINELMESFSVNGKLSLGVYETLITINSKYPEIHLLDDIFVDNYKAYIEKLYHNEPPLVHEYKNLDRSLFRVQSITNKLVESLTFSSFKVDTLLNMLTLVYELESANPRSSSIDCLSKIFDYINDNDLIPETTQVFLRQDSGDESTFESYVLSLWLFGKKYNNMLNQSFESVIDNSLFYSPERIIQAKLFQSLSKVETEEQIFDKAKQDIQTLLQDISNDTNIDYQQLYINILQLFVLSRTVSPRGTFIDALDKWFTREFDIEIPLVAYKIRIDKAIRHQDHIVAINTFDDSIQNMAAWSELNSPAIIRTLNDLIVIACKKVDDIETVFSIFTKIKQQMVNHKANVHAITQLAKRMLDVEYVGDLIEMLKRELPDIDRDDEIKLSTEHNHGIPYRKLFYLLHNFVINYTNEATFETNWVLYGELHKYFHVPYKTYLPAMKFFCEQGRMNAALIIFRQIRKLYELHGNHNNLPPLKEMYMYLFQEFGNTLYEEGVKEVHEYLKMDVAITQTDIGLQNSILNAYSNLQDVAKVHDLFLSMASLLKLEGGVDENTAQIMIKTYTYGDMNYVREFWNNLSSFGISIDYNMFRQYLIAHVYHGYTEDAITLTEEMNDFGFEVTEDVISSMYNFCLNSTSQLEIENWAKEHHNQLWIDLKTRNLLKPTDDYMPENNLLAQGSN